MKDKINEESLNFIKSYEALLKNDEGFAEEYLISKGYDPEILGIDFENIAHKFILLKKAASARKQLSSKLNRAKSVLQKMSLSTEEGLNRIQQLLNPQLAKKYALNFRELKEMKESEAIKILTDIEILEILEKEYDNDDSKEKG